LLDATFSALADPTRRAIVARLAEGDATVLELAEPFQISLPAISSTPGAPGRRAGIGFGAVELGYQTLDKLAAHLRES
jgi:hypothetical protein